MEITLRKATLDDLDLLQYWDTQPHVIAAAPDSDWAWGAELSRNDPWQEILIAERESKPIGVLQIIDPFREASHYWGAVEPDMRAIDIWIGEKENLGKGYGTQMMQRAFERCFADPAVKGILIDPLASNTRARHFYETLGFSFVEYRHFDDDLCAVYFLSRKKWEQ